MAKSIDAKGPGQIGSPMHDPKTSLFFIVFIVLGNFYMVNLFVSIAIDSFRKQKAKHNRQHGLSPRQKLWAQAVTQAITHAPQDRGFQGQTGMRMVLLQFVTGSTFDWMVLLVILLNIVLLALPYYGMSEDQELIQEWGGRMFTALFILEAVLKIGGMGVAYFRSFLNTSDFIIVVLSIIEEVFDVGPGTIVAVLRVSRVFLKVMHAYMYIHIHQ